MRYKSYIISIFFLLFCLSLEAKDATPKSGSQTATELFNKVYNLVFGPQGSALSYKVKIIGLYKTEGNIVYKGIQDQQQEKQRKPKQQQPGGR